MYNDKISFKIPLKILQNIKLLQHEKFLMISVMKNSLHECVTTLLFKKTSFAIYENDKNKWFSSFFLMRRQTRKYTQT
jgi:hypothetical protein